MSSDSDHSTDYNPPERSFDTFTFDKEKRKTLGVTALLGAAGGAAVAIPLVSTFTPSERAKAAGAPVEIDIAELRPGEMMTTEWRGNPVWVLRRTPEMIDNVKQATPDVLDPNSEAFYQLKTPEYATNEVRSIKPELLVVVGICSHLGCSPSNKFDSGPQPSLPDDWPGGFLCPCHGSTFDLAGRVFPNKPANKNLDVPPHMYLSDTRLLIGEDESSA